MILHLQFLHINRPLAVMIKRARNLETLLNLTFKKLLKTSLRPAVLSDGI